MCGIVSGTGTVKHYGQVGRGKSRASPWRQGTEMRYDRAERLIQLALEMQAARGGLTIADIEERFGVSRRTAIRLRDAVIRAFPHASEVESGDRRKRWRLPARSAQTLISVTADDLAVLNLAIRGFEQQGLPAYAETLSGLGSKVRGLLEHDVVRRIEPDLAAIADAEISDSHSPKRPTRSGKVVKVLREALKSCKKVMVIYSENESISESEFLISPMYMVYSNRHFIYAKNEISNKLHKYFLDCIKDAKILPDSFVCRPSKSITNT